jgi:hypothetical protein
MSSLVPVIIHLSKAQVLKEAQGRPIQINAANLHKGTHTIHVHPENHKKVAKKVAIPENNICFKDRLNDYPPSPGGYIINLADSTTHGTHWVSLWV